jgi:hypothetical protein
MMQSRLQQRLTTQKNLYDNALAVFPAKTEGAGKSPPDSRPMSALTFTRRYINNYIHTAFYILS